MSAVTALDQDQIAVLHRKRITGQREVLQLLRAVKEAGVELNAGVSRAAAARQCTIIEASSSRLVLTGWQELGVAGRTYFFTFDQDGQEYFFSATLQSASRRRLWFSLPAAVFLRERRESTRVAAETLGVTACRVGVSASDLIEANVRDVSRGGLGVALPTSRTPRAGSWVVVDMGTAAGEKRRLYGRVRCVRNETAHWSRVGLAVSSVRASATELQEASVELDGQRRGWAKFSIGRQVASTAIDRGVRRLLPKQSSRPLWSAERVYFRNQLGQPLVGLVNTSQHEPGAPAIVIPPAWGKTKETLLPLALVIVETCLRHGLPVTVLRYDGTNRRGEAFVEEECRKPGEEYKRFRFSQAVEDLRAAMRFLRADPRWAASQCVVVSFSLSAIEARRAVADAGCEEIAGWIPVVGMVDLQSGLRAVSGGVDYAEGILRGVTFGVHELVGVLSDMDFTGRDALRHNLVFNEDARQDMERISAPVTWVHGEHDAWMDLERVRRLLDAGDASRRKLVRVPTGHQLRSSTEALGVFELIATEAVRMAWGREVQPASPSLREIDRARAKEASQRKTRARVNLHSFWSDYLLGKERRVGMELFTATSAYQELMRTEVDRMKVEDGCCAIDVGAGTGGFLREIELRGVRKARVVAIDLVQQALARARAKTQGEVEALCVQVDLDREPFIPCKDGSFQVGLASLVLSYLSRPEWLLKELGRVVRSGGLIVASTLKRDADISRIYRDGVLEVAAHVEPEVGSDYSALQRSFLNEAARLLDLEEDGVFKFYEPREFASLFRRAGLKVESVDEALGAPPQAVVITARVP